LLNFFKNIFSFSLGFLPRIKPVCFIVLCFTLLLKNSFSQQNLVYNGDFEEYSSCPDNASSPFEIPYQIEKCVGWTAPTYGTSDYFNACSVFPVSVSDNFGGNQLPYSGNGYLGGYFTSYTGGSGTDSYSGIMWWEYIQGSLVEPLQNGKIYQLSLKVSLAELSDLMINEIGVFFSNNPISSENTSNLKVNPQCVFYEPSFFGDTTEWMHLETIFIANGGEKFLTIGNFKDDLSTDTLRRFDGEPLYSNPFVTYMFVDDVKLIQFHNDLNLTNVFTPNNDGINDLLTFPSLGNINHKVTVLNRWGNLIYESSLNTFSWNGEDLEGKNCIDGTYFYRINNTNISGFIQLVR
jgi:gliding motility-associated-like protein